MRLQRKILELFNIPLKVTSTFELNGLFQIAYTAHEPVTSKLQAYFRTYPPPKLFNNSFPFDP